MNRTRKNSMNQRNVYILIVTAVVLPSQLGSADVPALTAVSAKQMVRMQDMRWFATLSAQQVDEVRSALRSSHGMVVEPALHNVVLHYLKELVPVVREGVGTQKGAAARPFRKICAEVLNSGSDPFEQLRQLLMTELPGDEFIPVCEKMDYCRPVRHMITSLIVIEEVQAVRTGQKKEADLAGLELSLFEKELAKFSGLGAGASVAGILDQLSKVRVIGPRETTLIQVLHTYPPQKYLPAVLDKLEQEPGSNGYEASLLWRSLRFRCDQLSTGEKGRLRTIIDSVRRSDPRPSLESTLSVLESELR